MDIKKGFCFGAVFLMILSLSAADWQKETADLITGKKSIRCWWKVCRNNSPLSPTVKRPR